MVEPAPGILLIAEPFLSDPNFSRTVVFLCDHQAEGSFGVVINRLSNHTLDELLNETAELKLPVYYGGPVQMDTIHFLHQYPNKIPGSFEVINGIYCGGEFETAIAMIRSGEIDTSRIRFYIGYSGWGTGQLAGELKEKSWLTSEATRKLVFHKDVEAIWKDALTELGGEYKMMINFPTDPRLN